MWHRLTILSLLLAVVGCGSTNSRKATEQLLMSDAIDRAISQIDFRALSGKPVYLDTTYVTRLKTDDYANTDYITSALRQQLFAAGCRVQESKETAEYIVEARVGALGTDDHEVVFGIPANNALSSVAPLIPSAPQISIIPEISLARREDQTGAAKVAVFAYHKITRIPVWQSGIAQARGHAKDVWILGAGPIQSGTIYNKTQFAGNEIDLTLSEDEMAEHVPTIPYAKEYFFPQRLPESGVEYAGFEDEPTKLHSSSLDEPLTPSSLFLPSAPSTTPHPPE